MQLKKTVEKTTTHTKTWLMRCTNVQMSQPLSPTYLKSNLTTLTPQFSLS